MNTEVLEQADSVVERNPLHQSAVIAWKLPKKLNPGAVPAKPGELEIPYLQFGHFVGGKAVNFFLHGGNESLADQEIRARVEVWERVKDNYKILYVDLHLVDSDTLLTHELFIRRREKTGRYWKVFQTGKFPLIVALNECDEAAKMSGPDKQLARLLREGWRIDSYRGNAVDLIKMGKSGAPKTMTHQRPKHLCS